jgi:hypothetical protein
VAKSRNELKIAPSIGISDENLTVVWPNDHRWKFRRKEATRVLIIDWENGENESGTWSILNKTALTNSQYTLTSRLQPSLSEQDNAEMSVWQKIGQTMNVATSAIFKQHRFVEKVLQHKSLQDHQVLCLHKKQ